MLALLTERCLFINFPFYHKTFVPEMDFDWGRHSQRLLAFGHDVTKTPPHELQVLKQMLSWPCLQASNCEAESYPDDISEGIGQHMDGR